MLSAGDGVGATDEELSAATGLSQAEMEALRAAAYRKPVSLDNGPPNIDADANYALTERVTTESSAAANAITVAAVAAVEALPEAERYTVMLRYFYQLKDEEIAQVLGLDDPARVRAVHERGILAVHNAMLREALTADAVLLVEATASGWCPWPMRPGPFLLLGAGSSLCLARAEVLRRGRIEKVGRLTTGPDHSRRTNP
jgi:hypothetical protein